MKTYKISTAQKLKNINNDARKIAQNFALDDLIEKKIMLKCWIYITLKDHAEDFPHNVPCRIINPSKSDIGKANKTVIDNINKTQLW